MNVTRVVLSMTGIVFKGCCRLGYALVNACGLRALPVDEF
jgi:hypothetical protein